MHSDKMIFLRISKSGGCFLSCFPTFQSLSGQVSPFLHPPKKTCLDDRVPCPGWCAGTHVSTSVHPCDICFICFDVINVTLRFRSMYRPMENRTRSRLSLPSIWKAGYQGCPATLRLLFITAGSSHGPVQHTARLEPTYRRRALGFIALIDNGVKIDEHAPSSTIRSICQTALVYGVLYFLTDLASCPLPRVDKHVFPSFEKVTNPVSLTIISTTSIANTVVHSVS